MSYTFTNVNVKQIEDKINLKENATNDGKNNLPRSTSETFSNCESEAIISADEFRNSQVSKAVEYLNSIKGKVIDSTAKLGQKNFYIDEFKNRIEQTLTAAEGKLSNLKSAYTTQNNEVRNFKLENIKFDIVDKCFGGIDEYNGELIVNAPCYFYEAYKQKKKHVATKTILLFDEDADGDLDINADDEVEINSTLIDVNGNLDVSGTLAQAGVATFALAANVAQVALSSSSNAVAWDASAAANAFHVTTENTTFSAPSNAVEGAFICLEINYNGSHTIAFNTVFEFAASTAPTTTDTDGKTDILVFRYNGAVWQEVGRTLNLSES